MRREIIFLLIFTLISQTSILASSVHSAQGDFGTDNTQKSQSVSDQGPAHNEAGSKEQATVVEHSIKAPELEKLKQQIGVLEEGRNSIQTIAGHGTGQRSPTEEEWVKIQSEMHIVDRISAGQMMTQLPSSVDHTTEPCFPPIGNQGAQGSCVAWAVGYYVKTYQEAREHGWDVSDGSSDRIVSPAFVYNLVNRGRDSGTSAEMAIGLICSVGACSLTSMPYNQYDYTSWPSTEAWRQAPLYRSDSRGCEYLSVETDAGVTSLKNWIASGNLAVLGVDGNKFSNGFWSLLTSNDVFTLDNYQNPQVNHENTIVGYDDNIEYVENGSIHHGAFKIANSWGIGNWLLNPWEHIDDGCYWISYETVKQRVGYCEFYPDRMCYQPELVASFQIDHSKRNECDITVGVETQSKRFSDYIDGGTLPFRSDEILFDITEFKETMPDMSGKIFFLGVLDGGGVATGVIREFAVESVQSTDTPVDTVNGHSVYALVTMPPVWTNLRGVHCERTYEKLDSGTSWSVMTDSSSWSGIVMKASISSANGGWLYGPYITASWDGTSMLGNPYSATFRLKVSSNAPTNSVAHIDVGYNAGSVLQSLSIKASDFASSNIWQDFSLTFITPNSLTYGLEFRVENLNSGLTDLYVDYITINRGWSNPTIYVESAYNKPKIAYGNPLSWVGVPDSSSQSGIVLKALASSASGSWLYGPYITEAWDQMSLTSKPYTAVFNLKVSSNSSPNNVCHLDVCCDAGNTVLKSLTIKADDFTSSNVWQDFNLTFVSPNSMTNGVEFRVVNLNGGITDLYVDKIALQKGWSDSTVYVESAYNKPKVAYGGSVSWSKLVDSSSWSGLVMKASASSASGSWLYGPYITTDLNGQSFADGSFIATFRLKVSSNLLGDTIGYVDVCCDRGTTILNSTSVRANDFMTSDTWQDIQLTFNVPSILTYGLEFRVVNLNSGITDLSVDTISIKTT